MAVEALRLEEMLVVCSVLTIFFAMIWSTGGLANILMKLVLIGIAFWTTTNTVILIWFS